METPALSHGLARCDEAAWAHFHERYYGWILSRAVSRGASAGDAPEIVQRVYLRVLRHARTFRETDDFEAWLCCLTRCEVIDAARSGKRRNWLGEKFQHWQTTRSAGQIDARGERLDEALARLEDVERTLVSRHYLEGWSQAELAEDAGTTVKAIERQLSRLRLRLRGHLNLPDHRRPT
ncbi:RNA polymerase sigma factor [Luteolibacter sp. SL250]|uniref:RNA polymerase sigma factor n=1 Tax=Luteolibacter sp. SL250 TaxID=2995170 RepID=UPI002270FA84|nr:RNA polymerase sigma factor [Luteolibacter sp. SL250]WAC19993.1 RNA polymerase sigma factor [Luteolibacter sp. SL250]